MGRGQNLACISLSDGCASWSDLSGGHLGNAEQEPVQRSSSSVSDTPTPTRTPHPSPPRPLPGDRPSESHEPGHIPASCLDSSTEAGEGEQRGPWQETGGARGRASIFHFLPRRLTARVRTTAPHPSVLAGSCHVSLSLSCGCGALSAPLLASLNSSGFAIPW